MLFTVDHHTLPNPSSFIGGIVELGHINGVALRAGWMTNIELLIGRIDTIMTTLNPFVADLKLSAEN